MAAAPESVTPHALSADQPPSFEGGWSRSITATEKSWPKPYLPCFMPSPIQTGMSLPSLLVNGDGVEVGIGVPVGVEVGIGVPVGVEVGVAVGVGVGVPVTAIPTTVTVLPPNLICWLKVPVVVGLKVTVTVADGFFLFTLKLVGEAEYGAVAFTLPLPVPVTVTV